MNDRTFSNFIMAYGIGGLIVAPLIGWSLGQYDLPPLLSVYIMMAIYMWPLVWLGARTWVRK